MDFPSSPATSSGPGQASFDALSAQVQAAVPLPTYTVATLPVADATNLNRLAGVSDLFGNRTTRVRCEKVTVAGVDYFYWQPQSSDSYGTVDVTSGSVTVGALTMPTSLNILGTVAAGLTKAVTLADGAFPGQTKELRMAGTLGLASTLNILGTGLGSSLSLLVGGYMKFASDWTSTPGSKAWTRIQ